MPLSGKASRHFTVRTYVRELITPRKMSQRSHETRYSPTTGWQIIISRPGWLTWPSNRKNAPPFGEVGSFFGFGRPFERSFEMSRWRLVERNCTLPNWQLTNLTVDCKNLPDWSSNRFWNTYLLHRFTATSLGISTMMTVIGNDWFLNRSEPLR